MAEIEWQKLQQQAMNKHLQDQMKWQRKAEGVAQASSEGDKIRAHRRIFQLCREAGMNKQDLAKIRKLLEGV